MAASSMRDQRYLELVSRLRLARRTMGLNQAELAQRLGRDQTFVSKYETAERRLDLLETLDVCAALGTTLALVTPAELRPLLGLPEGGSDAGQQ